MNTRYVRVTVMMICLILFALSGSPASAAAPAAPSSLTAKVINPTWIRLDWVDNSDSESGFKIERRILGTMIWTQIADLRRADLTAYVDTYLLPGTTYQYRVRAYNATGNSAYSNPAAAKTPGTPPPTGPIIPVFVSSPPAAPGSLTVKPISLTWIEKPSLWLNWKDNSDNEAGFMIWRKEGELWKHLAAIGPNVTDYVDTCLPYSTIFGYKVTAFNHLGTSTSSNTVHNKTVDPPEPESEPDVPETVVIRLFINQTGYSVNDELKEMDVAPIIQHGRTLLPIRYIAENIGAVVSWDTVESKATVTLGEKTIELWIGQNRARINGAYQYIDQYNHNVVPIIVPPGRTMLPLRFIAETMGCQVDWNGVTQEVTVIYPAP